MCMTANYLAPSGAPPPPPPGSFAPLLLPKMLPMTPVARAGFKLDSARVAKLVLPCRARMRDALAAAAAAAGGLLAGPWLDAGGVPKGLGVSPPLSRCSAAGERQPSPAALASSVRRMECIAGLMLLGRVCKHSTRMSMLSTACQLKSHRAGIGHKHMQALRAET